MVLFGTRPEGIKMAPLIKNLQSHERMEPVVVVTGQHREMLAQVNDLFGIIPTFDLDVMRQGASLSELTSRVLNSTDQVIADAKPDAVVVQGDTTSAFAGALAAFYRGVPVVHLEAGLRTGDLTNPFPEEGNRRLIAPLAELHLAPTETSLVNLEREGVASHAISVTGNTVIDALFESLKIPVSFGSEEVGEWVRWSGPRMLVTTHRRESWGQPMRDVMTAVAKLAVERPSLSILLPMHRNELVREVVEAELGGIGNVTLVDPLGYHEFVHVQSAADVILTDSGGVQEEAPSLGVPVLVLRSTTERPEAVDAGTVRLVGTDPDNVYHAAVRLLDDPAARARMSEAINPYGDGRAGARAAAAIAQLLGVGRRMAEFR